MTDKLLERCKLFEQNLRVMRENFKGEVAQLYASCANIYTDMGIELNPGRIKTAEEIIKDNTSFFSNFRSMNTTITLATFLSIEEDPQQVFDEISFVYNILKELFSSSAYLVLAAYLIVKTTPAKNYRDITDKTRIIFDMIKKEHFFLTSYEDVITAVQFALCNRKFESIIFKSEEFFELFRYEIGNRNTVQAISNILALSNKDSKELKEKTMEIINKLKSHKYKLTSGIELSVFSALAMSKMGTEQIVNDILEVAAYLLTVKGFGNMLTESKLMDQKLLLKRRLTNSAILVLNEYTKNAKQDISISKEDIDSLVRANTMVSLDIIISCNPSNI